MIVRPMAHIKEAEGKTRDGDVFTLLNQECMKAIKAGEKWPDVCYMTVGHVREILKAHLGRIVHLMSLADMEVMMELGESMFHWTTSLAAWRMTKGIYRVPPVILDDIWKRSMETASADSLTKMKEWCYYIETPGRVFNNLKMPGFFFCVDYAVDKEFGEMMVALVTPDLDIYGEIGQGHGYFPLIPGKPFWYHHARTFNKTYSDYAQFVPLISCVQWLNELVTDDIVDPTKGGVPPSIPKAQKTKSGPKLAAASKVTYYTPGYRLVSDWNGLP